MIQRCGALRDVAPPAAADVSALPQPRVGRDRGVGTRHRVQLRDAAPSADAVLRRRLHRRARRARGRRAAREQPGATSRPTTRRSACRCRCGSTPSTTTWCCPCSCRRRRHDRDARRTLDWQTRAGRRCAPGDGHRSHADARRRGRDRVARLHARAPRPRLREPAGRARHLHEHPLRHRATAAASSPTGPAPTR